MTDELEKTTDRAAVDEASSPPAAPSRREDDESASGDSAGNTDDQATESTSVDFSSLDDGTLAPAASESNSADEEVEDDEPVSSAGAIEESLDTDADETVHMDWYILKVQSNRERSIAEALQRKMAMEGLDRFFDQAIVPTEKVTEFKAGKKRVVERKLYPGYIVVHMHINEDTWFAVRETSGIGDFTGAAGKPTPMLPHEVSRIVRKEEEVTTEEPKLDIQFRDGDRVKIKEGNFESFEGEVSSVDAASGRVTVMINIFGRSTPVELEYWHLESV